MPETLIICRSSFSKPSAWLLRDTLRDMGVRVRTTRSGDGHVNWGRRSTEALLNPNLSVGVNKTDMRVLFAEHNVPMPLLNPVDQFPVVARTEFHSRGEGYWLCNTQEELDAAYEEGAHHHMLYISDALEYRCHIFQGRSIRLVEKDFTRPREVEYPDGRSVRYKYTTMLPRTRRLQSIRNASRQAVDALGMDFGAVDILVGDTDPYVLEVNGAPSLFGGTTMNVYATKIKQWWEDLELC